MKKFFVFLIVLIMIRTIGVSQPYTYESIRYFSDWQISNMMSNIAKVNPHIKDLNWIYPGEILNIPVDGTFISLYINKGDNVYNILGKKGIPERQILEAKFINSSLGTESKLAPKKEKSPPNLPNVRSGVVPLYIWLCVAGICLIFISMAIVYIKLKKYK